MLASVARWLVAILIGWVAPLGSPLAGQQEPTRYTYEATHMGTVFRIVGYADDAPTADRASEAAFAHVARLDSLFSDYRVDSEIAKLANQSGTGATVPVSPELWALLNVAQEWAERSDGAFDVTVGPLTRLWRWSARRGELPAPPRLASAQAAVGFDHLVLLSEPRGIRLDEPGMSLDLGGIAKGFAADAALEVLADYGIAVALVDAGGDIAVGAAPPSQAGWQVELPDGRSIRLAHAAVATSGDAHRFVTVGGVRYSHIVDSRTGLGVVDAPTITVVAPNAATADALASALTVMEPSAAQSLARTLANTWVSATGSPSWTRGPKPEIALPIHPLGRSWRDRP